MKKGILIYDSSTNRFDILYEEGNSMAACTAELQWRS